MVERWNMETQEIIQKIYSHVESGAVDKAVFACVRLARSVGDIISLLGFLRELSSDRNQFSTQLFEETRNLKEEAQSSCGKQPTKNGSKAELWSISAEERTNRVKPRMSSPRELANFKENWNSLRSR